MDRSKVRKRGEGMSVEKVTEYTTGSRLVFRRFGGICDTLLQLFADNGHHYDVANAVLYFLSIMLTILEGQVENYPFSNHCRHPKAPPLPPLITILSLSKVPSGTSCIFLIFFSRYKCSHRFIIIPSKNASMPSL